LKKIIVTEHQREMLLKEGLITERQLSNVLYHFTNIENLYDILNENVMKSELPAIHGAMKTANHPDLINYYSFSFTRMKNGSLGYQGDGEYPVRIQFDGFKLQQISGKKEQFDYYSHRHDNINPDTSTLPSKRTYNTKTDRNQNYNEAEDRILIHSDNGVGEIPNISKYITRIDVYLSPYRRITVASKLSKYQDRIHFYNNRKDFDFQTDNTIDLDEWIKVAQKRQDEPDEFERFKMMQTKNQTSQVESNMMTQYKQRCEMLITEAQLNNKSKYLIEHQLSNILYHYTSIKGLYNILQEDKMISRTPAINSKMDPHDYTELLNYISFSFTRMKYAGIGYPTAYHDVRIQFDGFKLQQIRGKKEQFDDFAHDGTNKRAGKQNRRTHTTKYSRRNERSGFEAEDRILIRDNGYGEAEIPDISKYITRIDMYVGDIFIDMVKDTLTKFLPYKDKINFYYDDEAFKFQTKNTIDLDEYLNEPEKWGVYEDWNMDENKTIKNKTMKYKSVIISESQLRLYLNYIVENAYDEGFKFTTNDDGTKTLHYIPGSDSISDTDVFNKPGDRSSGFKVRTSVLPKSGVTVYNLYDLRTVKITQSLKHNKLKDTDTPVQFNNTQGQYKGVTGNAPMDNFFQKTYQYIYSLIKNKEIDYLVSPQSSSEFNAKILNALKAKLGNSVLMLDNHVIPSLLQKDVKGIYVDEVAARQAGLNSEEIIQLKNRVKKWHRDEDRRSLVREKEQLEKEVEEMMMGRTGKGRPLKAVTTRQQDIKDLEAAQLAIRKTNKDQGIDPIFDKNGKVKDWQIKSIDDKTRKAINGIFSFSPPYQENRWQDKFRGKNFLIFDDNYSSGVSLDQSCLALKKANAGEIIAVTLGLIPQTAYGKDRVELAKQKD
jgi:hypothetical protein